MISIQEARDFAEAHFPNAPEDLANHLNIDVQESDIDGCDGWCLTTGEQTIIRINSELTPTRRRFTLAHELSHFILGVPAVVGESFEDMLRSNSAEERQVDELASELLIPKQVVQSFLPAVPVVAEALKKLAKKANVSELAAAIRVCNLAREIGLINASVVLFDDELVRWQRSTTLTMPDETAMWLLAESRKVAPQAFRAERPVGDVIVASSIENRYFGSATLFVQLLPLQLGLNRSREETRRELEDSMFGSDTSLRNRVSGLVGYHKNLITGMSLEEAEALFWDRNETKLKDTPLNSEMGREYMHLRISEWFQALSER